MVALTIRVSDGIDWKIGSLNLTARTAGRAFALLGILAAVRLLLARLRPFAFAPALRQARDAFRRAVEGRVGLDAGFYVVLAVLSLWACLGPGYVLYTTLYRLLPGFDLIRVPSRLFVLTLLALAVLAAKGLDRLLAPLAGRRRAAAGATVVVLLTAELAAFPLETRPYTLDLPAIDRELAARPRPFTVVELPVADPANATQSARLHSHYMLHSMAHWQPMVNGYSGIIPPRHERLFRILTAFPDTASLRELESLGVTLRRRPPRVLHRGGVGALPGTGRGLPGPPPPGGGDERRPALRARRLPAAPLTPPPVSRPRMESPRHPVFADIEQDAEASVAEAFARIAVEYFAATRTGEGRVSTALGPDDLARRFEEPLPRSGRPVEDVLERLRRDVIPDSNHLCHPRSMGHQVSAPLPAAVWTESLVAALNQSAAVWEMSPVGTILEARVVRWMCDLAGLGPEAGGTFTSGGTEATFAALLAARAAALPNAWKEGVGAVPPVVLHGEHAHYAVARAVGELGLGTDNAVAVPSRGFRMDVAALEDELDGIGPGGGGSWRWWRRRARPPPARSTTSRRSAGCARRGGSGCTWTAPTGRPRSSRPRTGFRVKGIERARSIAWDPHKMMLMPLSASVVLVRRRAGPRRRLQPARAVPLPRPRGRADLGPGGAQLPVLAPAGRDQGVGGPPAVRGGRPRRPLRPPVRHRAGPPRPDRGAARLRGAPRARVEHPLLPVPRRRLARRRAARRPQPAAAGGVQPLRRRLDHDDDARRPAGPAGGRHEPAHHAGRHGAHARSASRRRARPFSAR